MYLYNDTICCVCNFNFSLVQPLKYIYTHIPISIYTYILYTIRLKRVKPKSKEVKFSRHISTTKCTKIEEVEVRRKMRNDNENKAN